LKAVPFSEVRFNALCNKSASTHLLLGSCPIKLNSKITIQVNADRHGKVLILNNKLIIFDFDVIGIAQYGDQYDAYSAGTEPTSVDPCAVTVMQEVGVDILKHRSKGLEEFDGQQFDYVVTLCADAQEACPIFVGGEIYLHHALNDPARVKETHADADRCLQFRAVRDQLQTWIDVTFGTAE
jgi:arsenate reductase